MRRSVRTIWSARRSSSAIVAHPKVRRLTSTEHFSVDGTLIEAWASMKSFKPKHDGGEPPDDGAPPPGAGRNAEVDFRGERRTNDTHASTTDPDARLFRKSRGTGAVLCFMGHALIEIRQTRPASSGQIPPTDRRRTSPCSSVAASRPSCSAGAARPADGCPEMGLGRSAEGRARRDRAESTSMTGGCICARC